MLCFCMGAGTDKADRRALASGFEVAKSPALVALFDRGQRVSSG